MTEWADPGYNMGGGTSTPSDSGGSFNWANAGAGTYASAFGTGLSFIGSIIAANQAKKAAEYNAQVIERNAQAAADAAEVEAQQHQRNAAIALGDILLTQQAQRWQEDQQRQQQEYVAGQTRAIVGASGLMLRGSPLATYEAGLRQSERTILAGRYKSQLQERALRDQATMESYAADVSRYGAGERLRVGKAQAALAEYGGSQQQFASLLGGFGNLASGAARTYDAYERHQYGRRGGTLLDPRF